MRGEVISLDGISGDGVILSDDGVRYAFTASASRSGLRVRDRVDFVDADGVARDIFPLAGGGAPAGFSPSPRPSGRGFNFGRAMFSFQGRLSRTHFWIGWAIVFFGYHVWSFIPFLNIALVVGAPVLLWSNLAIGAKRLHDMGRSAWLIAIPWSAMIGGFVYLIVVISMAAINDPTAFDDEGDLAQVLNILVPPLGVWGFTAFIGVGFWLWLGIADGQRGANRFGPDPVHPARDTADTFN